MELLRDWVTVLEITVFCLFCPFLQILWTRKKYARRRNWCKLSLDLPCLQPLRLLGCYWRKSLWSWSRSSSPTRPRPPLLPAQIYLLPATPCPPNANPLPHTSGPDGWSEDCPGEICALLSSPLHFDRSLPLLSCAVFYLFSCTGDWGITCLCSNEFFRALSLPFPDPTAMTSRLLLRDLLATSSPPQRFQAGGGCLKAERLVLAHPAAFFVFFVWR